MKNEWVRKALPHVLAIAIFLVISLIFCKPALEGNVLDQHDIVGWKGMAQNAFDYKEKHGHFPLWNPALFSGMPNYLIAMDGKSILPDMNKLLSLGLPQPANMFFLAALCFYILCLSWGARPVVGIFGGLMYAFATYNPIIIAAGHITKMFAIAYMPLMLAGILLVYRKKYWIGLTVSTLGAYLLLNANHPQITYYFLIIAGFVTIGYLIDFVQKKDFKHIGVSFGLLAIAAITGALTTSLSLLTTSEYAKYTMRGGKSVEIQGENVQVTQTKGLDTSYAFSYSLGPGEVLTTMMPGVFGKNLSNTMEDNSTVISAMEKAGLPSSTASQIAAQLPAFWGDPNSSGGGPFYSGVIVCLLALITFILYKNPLRWALLALGIVSIMMALGKYMPGFNTFLFENLPFYNKFRAPSITMVIPQVILPFLAIISLQLLFFRKDAAALLKADFKKILYALGGLILVLGLFYMTFNYSSVLDANFSASFKSQGADDNLIRAIIGGLKDARQSMFGAQVLRTLAYALLLAAILWAFSKNIVKASWAIGILATISLIDLLAIDRSYLNEDKYVPAEEMEVRGTRKTAIDQQILADKEVHFRIYNAGQEKFSASDYHYPAFHRTLGGYHPAKLRIYQDVLERYLYGGTDPSQILNMLNAKYIVFTNPQNGQPLLQANGSAYGPVWLVKHITTVPDVAAELQAIGSTNLKDTAVLLSSIAETIPAPSFDSTARIQLTQFDNDALTYSFEAKAPQFAVFSEVYYPAGWNAYVDGQKVDYVKTNYLLRGLAIPAGKHEIKFVFEPEVVKKGMNYSYIGSWLVLIIVIGGLFMQWRSCKQAKA